MDGRAQHKPLVQERKKNEVDGYELQQNQYFMEKTSIKSILYFKAVSHTRASDRGGDTFEC